MIYDFIPQIIIGIILIVVGIRLNMNNTIADIVRLGLVLIGIVVLGYGVFGATDQLS